jgi:hypothetical protein
MLPRLSPTSQQRFAYVASGFTQLRKQCAHHLGIVTITVSGLSSVYHPPRDKHYLEGPYSSMLVCSLAQNFRVLVPNFKKIPQNSHKPQLNAEK